MKRPTLKRIGRLLARHQREAERGRARYTAAGAALERALSLGVPLGEPIGLPDGRQLIVRDQFAQKNVAFRAACVNRFVVETYRPEKTHVRVTS